MFTAHSGTSSKRICGTFGWVITVGVLIYCTIKCIQAPTFIDTFIIASTALLGVDSVTGIWKDKTDRINDDADQVLDKAEEYIKKKSESV